jgi:large subunit ribosomal protein L6
MSRIGKLPITIPETVTVSQQGNLMSFKGTQGELEFELPKGVEVTLDGKTSIIVAPTDDSNDSKSKWGMVRTCLNNCVIGVSEGYSKELDVQGVGYRASTQGKDLLRLVLGYSHDILYRLPEGITAQVQGQIITIKGISKQKVGQIAAEIRSFRKPEPYKGKGVRYKGERILLKVGKKK